MKALLALFMLASLLGCETREIPAAPGAITELRGQWVVVNYWAPWCKPCIEEIPQLNMLNKDYDEITVLGVNYDGATGEVLAEQEERLGVEFPTLAADPAAEIGVPRPVVLPTTLILNPAGEVTATLLGPQTVDSLLLATIKTPPQ